MAHEKRDLHGVILLDKPQGVSSNRALQRVKHLLRARKAGHTGSLDPLATGMLPICLGDATRFSQYLLDANKRYRVHARLGASSTTGDGEGALSAPVPISDFSHDEWQAVANRFVGEIEQTPPMYSALKHDGKRLYEIARQGKTVERPARRITVVACTVISIDEDVLELDVLCSKGTYIRTLVEDIATAAGTLAWTERLHRTAVSPFHQPMISLESLETDVEQGHDPARHLLPVASCIETMPSVDFDQAASLAFCEGQAVDLEYPEGRYQCVGPESLLLGVVEIDSDGKIAGRKVLSSARETLSR